MPVRLFVGNLPYHATEAELRELFSAVGPLTYVSLPTDRESGQPRGFAFIEFSERAQAEEAIRRFNNQAFKGRRLAVNEARVREDRQQAGAPSRPSFNRPSSTTQPDPADPPAPGNKPSRNFGPDASAQRNRGKTKGGSKSERTPKGPMREMVRGQFFGEDDSPRDELQEEQDFHDDDYPVDYQDEEPGGEKFTSRLNDPKS
ncbi:MAG TPA: RNA-binding protein [Blastocatellia bacterium]|nr:RNA-binding protein [Blastocatellia bacterium]